MASNFLPVGLLDQPWSEEDSLGTLSSLERRQRKAAEKSDINAFYKLLGIVFVTLNLVLLGSELYTFATEPSRGLTGAFLLEIGRLSGLAYGQLQNLYRVVGDIAWTGIAVVHGHDFAQRGVDIAEGVAKLLGSGLFYLSLMLTALIIYYACYGIWRTPLRTIVLGALAIALLLSAPQLYEWLVPRLCKTSNAEPVVIWALVFGGAMCLAPLLMTRTVCNGAGEGPTSIPASTVRQRGAAALRRQSVPSSGVLSGSAPSAPAGSGGSGHKRGLYSRPSSSGRSGSAVAAGAAAPAGADATQASMPRSCSSASLTGLGLFASFACLSGGGTAGGAGSDPVGIHASARGLHRSCSVSSSSAADVTSSASSSGQAKHAGAATASGNANGSRGGPMGHHSSSYDPAGVTASNMSPRSAAGTPGSSHHPSSGVSNNSCSSNCNRSTSMTAAKGSTSSSSSGKQRQQQHSGGSSYGGGGGADGSSTSKTKSAAASSGSNHHVLDTSQDSSPGRLGPHGGGGGTKQQGPGHQTAITARLQHDPTSPSPLIQTTATTSHSSSSLGLLSTKKKAAGNNLNSNTSTGSCNNTAAVTLPFQTSTSSGSGGRHQQQQQHQGAILSMPSGSSAHTTVAVAHHTGTTGTGGRASKHAAKDTTTAGGVANITAAAVPSGGLFSRLTASVASAAGVAPVMASRTAKKVTAAAPPAVRKIHMTAATTTPPPPPPHQYIILPPPPPPPPRKTQPAASDPIQPPSTTTASNNGTSGVVQPGAGAPGNCSVRNPWLNPNPVIKLASGVAKATKDAASAAPCATKPRAVASPLTASASPLMADFQTSRSSGGVAATHFGTAVSATSPSRRSASYGGASAIGVSSVDPPVFDNSPHGHIRSPIFSSLAASMTGGPASPPPPVVRAAIGQPVIATTASTATALGVPASTFMSLQTQEQLRNHFQANATTAPGSFISATFVSTDATVGPLVAHKHASGDLDIANVAANYRPYPSGSLSPAATTVPPNESESADSFSLFSTPPPLITADAANDTVAGLDCGVAATQGGGIGAPHMQYGNHGVYGNYTALPSLGNDPVWGHNVSSIFGTPPRLHGPQTQHMPPPGFPGYAYGGAFATGPVSGGCAVTASAGWEQVPGVAAGGAASQHPSDALPLPPAGENGILASLGFVDDGNSSTDGTSGGGGGGSSEDTAASCAICWSAPRQVGFLHGKTSHLCVCRRCAAKLREGVHRCPMCRQLIERIIDIY